ncbi:hypothetical protein PIB30_078495 [Stylosanthes scabra]|uniref:Uncharacterized protein n=1 Tax=Stylosanthes scabra TaxID=79078 RepID=A0ABU6SRJ1_9FABA|nr:hypothetical protein [Stylosanthes scabra]
MQGVVKFGWPTPRRGTSRLGVDWLSGGMLGKGFKCVWELVEGDSEVPRREVTRLGVGEEKEQKEDWKARKEENRATVSITECSLLGDTVVAPRRGRATRTIWPHPTPNA